MKKFIKIKEHNFEVVKEKNLEDVIKRYYESNIYSIFKAYKSPSYEKIHTFNYLRELAKDMNGYGFYIIGYNCHAFSVGWCVKLHDREYFIYVTKDHNRIMEI